MLHFIKAGPSHSHTPLLREMADKKVFLQGLTSNYLPGLSLESMDQPDRVDPWKDVYLARWPPGHVYHWQDISLARCIPGQVYPWPGASISGQVATWPGNQVASFVSSQLCVILHPATVSQNSFPALLLSVQLPVQQTTTKGLFSVMKPVHKSVAHKLKFTCNRAHTNYQGMIKEISIFSFSCL